MAYTPKNINGQATMANSEPVVIASDQSAVPVSGTVTANIGTVATLATAAKQDTGNTSLGTIAGAVSGTEMQVDVLTMPTVVVDLGANNDVTVTSGAITETNSGSALTALQLIDDVIYVDDADWTDSTSKHALVGGLYQATPQTVTDGDVAPFNMTTNGALHVAVQNGVTVDLGVNNDVTVTGTVTANLSATDNAVLDAIEADTTTIAGAISGTEMQVDVLTMPTVTVTATNLDVQSGGADLATSTQAGAIQTAVELIDDTVRVLGTDTYTEATSKGVVMGAVRRDADTTLANTTNEFAPLQVDANGYLKVEIFDGGGSHTVDGTVAASQSGTWTVQPGNTQNTTEWLVIDKATTSGGLSKFHLVSAATTNATNVKASAGQVYSITAFNLNASPRYLKFHNTAGTPTAGSGVTDTFLIPGNTSGAGLVINFDKGIAFATGIGITLVTGITDANASAVAADEIVVQVYYK